MLGSGEHGGVLGGIVGRVAAPEEEGQVIHATLGQHYRQQLDEPVPALDNIPPRQAARSTSGREKLVAWLKLLENHAARQRHQTGWPFCASSPPPGL